MNFALTSSAIFQIMAVKIAPFAMHHGNNRNTLGGLWDILIQDGVEICFFGEIYILLKFSHTAKMTGTLFVFSTFFISE